VKVWYDQANGNDAEQTTTGSQPKIYDSSTGIVEDGSAGNEKPAMQFDGVNDGYLLNTTGLDIGSLSSFMVGKLSDTDGNEVMLGLGGSLDDRRWYAPFASGDTFRYGYADDALAITAPINANQNLHAMIAGTTLNGVEAWLNSTSVGTATRTTGAVSFQNGIANLAQGFYANCKIQEVIVYDSDQSSNRTGIETNINDYYSIYTP
jgi:hypothetical protein